MDDLKELVTLIKELPTLAIWVLAGFLVYKLAVVGSIYAVIKLGIDRLHSFLTMPKTKTVQYETKIRNFVIENCMDDLMEQLRRLKGINSSSSTYIHQRDVDWLRKAIDERLERGEPGELPTTRC